MSPAQGIENKPWYLHSLSILNSVIPDLSVVVQVIRA